MKTVDVIVIGRGLFGSMITHHLRDNGLDVLVIDSNEPMAASKCSFGVWKEGWINEVIKKEAAAGMDLLEKFADGIEDIEFYNTKKDRIEAFKRVDCSVILDNDDYEYGRIVNIDKRKVRMMDLSSGDHKEFTVRRAIVVAAGAWTSDVLRLCEGIKNVPKLDKIWGVTMDLKLDLKQNRITEWAPYRQSVLVRKDNIFQFGDGATVKNPKENDPRLDKASDRSIIHLNEVVGSKVHDNRIMDVNEGYRPYLQKGSPNFVTKHNDWLISATGGAKNSTILCGYVAKTVLEMIA